MSTRVLFNRNQTFHEILSYSSTPFFFALQTAFQVGKIFNLKMFAILRKKEHSVFDNEKICSHCADHFCWSLQLPSVLASQLASDLS